MKQRGFTLIELLAVIVILAIIALIATPIILNIIGNAKDNTVLRSGELYLDAVEQAIVRENLSSKFNPSKCIVKTDGNLKCSGETIVIDMNGNKPNKGIIILENGKIKSIENLVLGEYELEKKDKEKLVVKGMIEKLNPKGTYLMESLFVSAPDSTFLGGNIGRNKVEKIKVMTTKNVPENAIDSWDVSETKDSSVMAWYTDEDSNGLYELYIGGDGGVKANPNSSFLFMVFENVSEIDVSGLDTSDVTNISNMFFSCKALLNLDLSNFDTSKVTNMQRLFQNSVNLKDVNLSSFNTSQVTNMSYMFCGCNNLEMLDLSNFDVSKTTDFNSIFYDCKKMIELDLTNNEFNETSNYSAMFGNVLSLKNVYVSNLNMKEFINGKLLASSKKDVNIIVINK